MVKSVKKSAEQKIAEAEIDHFRQDLGPFVVAVQTSRIAMLFTDAKAADNPILFVNDSFLALTGYERGEVIGHSFNSMLARGVDAATRAKVETAVSGASADGLVVRYSRKDGSEFWTDIFISPVHDAAGGLVQHFVSFIDLSRHKEDQAHFRVLIDELNHRVKNTLSTVQSIVRQALRRTADPVLIRQSIETRLLALSRSHDLLTRDSWEGAGMVDLVESIRGPFEAADGGAARFEVAGENVRLTPKTTLALGIALLELATNAGKYGALSNEGGSVEVTWTVERKPQGDRLHLCWREKGGPPVTPPTEKGFGSQVLERGLAHELGGEASLDYRPDGLVCTIDLPAPMAPLHG